MADATDICVVGGGFFGLMIAACAAESGLKVVVLEREPELMQRASLKNQARVHNGYHYPRSYLTAARSAANFPRFCDEFAPAVQTDLRKVYAVARHGSKVPPTQFLNIFRSMGVPIAPARPDVARLFDPRHIAAAYECVEYVFDANRLREMARARCLNAGVQIWLSCEARSAAPMLRGVRLALQRDGLPAVLDARLVFNATYSRLRGLSRQSAPALRHELTEMCLFEPPELLAGMGVTVMCGPFFSVMPYPAAGHLYTLSHVRYTPHVAWVDAGSVAPDPYEIGARWPRQTAFPLMSRDAARYIPGLAPIRQTGSIWEVKTILPRSDVDDGRPILFHASEETPGLYSVLGGKMDNFYDAVQEAERIFANL